MANVAVIKNGKTLHVYPVYLGALNYDPTEEEFIKLARKSALEDRLISEDEEGITFEIFS